VGSSGGRYGEPKSNRGGNIQEERGFSWGSRDEKAIYEESKKKSSNFLPIIRLDLQEKKCWGGLVENNQKLKKINDHIVKSGGKGVMKSGNLASAVNVPAPGVSKDKQKRRGVRGKTRKDGGTLETPQTTAANFSNMRGDDLGRNGKGFGGASAEGAAREAGRRCSDVRT